MRAGGEIGANFHLMKNFGCIVVLETLKKVEIALLFSQHVITTIQECTYEEEE